MHKVNHILSGNSAVIDDNHKFFKLEGSNWLFVNGTRFFMRLI